MLDPGATAVAGRETLLGRASTLKDILGRVGRSRCVTLTGPGSGKTRLGAAVVHALRSSGTEAWFVDASSAREAATLASLTATALEVSGRGAGDAREAVAAFLAGRRTLICFDNMEQVIGAGESIGDLLVMAPDLTVLMTSRVALHVPDEIEVLIPPLDLPASDAAGAVEESAAGALFLRRARALGRLEHVDAMEATAIAELLRRLDGLPLAVELAAARTRVMRPAEILTWLTERGSVVVDQRDGNPQRSLAAIFDWTFELLTPPQREALAAASVCSGFDLHLIEGLVSPDVDVIDALDSLVSLGLVRLTGETDGSFRFGLLETVRDHIRRRLPDAELGMYLDRHAAAMRASAIAFDMRLHGPDQGGVLEALEAEAANFRLALDRTAELDPEAGLEMWRTLQRLWQSGYRQSEGIARFEAMAKLTAPSLVRSRAMSRYVGLVFEMKGPELGEAANRDALELARAVGDVRSEVEALGGIAWIAQERGDVEGVTAAADAAEVASRSIDDPIAAASAAQARCIEAVTVYGPASDEALEALRRAAAAATIADQFDLVLSVQANLAFTLMYRDEYVEAVSAAGRAVGLARSMRHQLLSWCLVTETISLLETGRVGEALRSLGDAIADVQVQQVPARVADVLTAGMRVSERMGDPVLTATLEGAIGELVGDPHGVGSSQTAKERARIMHRVRQQAPQIDIELAIRDGATLGSTQMLERLPGLLDTLVEAVPSNRPRLRHGDLTRREVEVLTLIGQGKSDPEIAKLLYISPKTASVHVANIKGKLGVASRVEIALRARDLDLV